MAGRQLSGTCYLQVVGYDTRSRWSNGSLTILKATQTKPKVLEPDAVLVKIKLVMPDAAFRALEPSAVIEVPEEMVQHPIIVGAVDANDG
jgi:hypothetical protein